ncbi:MAG: S-methyl-5-thioribose-1-phosphate isomerase [Candidatus Bathyarchaeota archaeon]|nr:S-methyl-5-thioribose-1-phosphate isomerase [Candidatus Termiticorpusculum sp.]
METVKYVAEKISTLEVKGARNATIAAIHALQMLAKQTTAENKHSLLNELTQAQQLLFNTRETEPLMRNAICYLIKQIQKSSDKKISELCTLLVTKADKFLNDLDISRELTAEIGATKIKNNMTIFTHCNSSTVTQMLIKAKQADKNFKVICTETRPAFQGRNTASELIKHNIETTIIVDSASQVFIPKTDFIVVGADAITPNGDIVNKIGTNGLAVLAHEAQKPFYVVSELLKFDPTTFYSELEGVEQRSPAEVWQDAPNGINVRNPAFDVTPHKYIHNLICEKGIIQPQDVNKIVQQYYPWLFQ